MVGMQYDNVGEKLAHVYFLGELEHALVDLLKTDPNDAEMQDQLEVVRGELTKLHAEAKADTAVVTKWEYMDALKATRSMLLKCRQAEAERVAKREAHLEALSQRMAGLRIDA